MFIIFITVFINDNENHDDEVNVMVVLVLLCCPTDCDAPHVVVCVEGAGRAGPPQLILSAVTLQPRH